MNMNLEYDPGDELNQSEQSGGVTAGACSIYNSRLRWRPKSISKIKFLQRAIAAIGWILPQPKSADVERRVRIHRKMSILRVSDSPSLADEQVQREVALLGQIYQAPSMAYISNR